MPSARDGAEAPMAGAPRQPRYFSPVLANPLCRWLTRNGPAGLFARVPDRSIQCPDRIEAPIQSHARKRLVALFARTLAGRSVHRDGGSAGTSGRCSSSRCVGSSERAPVAFNLGVGGSASLLLMLRGWSLFGVPALFRRSLRAWCGLIQRLAGGIPAFVDRLRMAGVPDQQQCNADKHPVHPAVLSASCGLYASLPQMTRAQSVVTAPACSASRACACEPLRSL